AGKYLPKSIKKIGKDINVAHMWSSSGLPHFFKAEYDKTDYEFELGTFDSDSLADLARAYNVIHVIPGAESGVEVADFLSEHFQTTSSNGTELSIARRDKM